MTTNHEVDFSILFPPGGTPAEGEPLTEPGCFHDLALDQIVASATAGFDDYDLLPFFRCPVDSRETIEYRHAAFKDLDGAPLAEAVTAFAAGMRRTRDGLARVNKMHYPRQKQVWLLTSARTYADTIQTFAAALRAVEPLKSAGFQGLARYVTDYEQSQRFRDLREEADAARRALTEIRYTLLISGLHIEVGRFEEQADYGQEVLATFARFRQGQGEAHRARFLDVPEMNHVEAEIVDRIALLFPDAFAMLDEFCAKHEGFVDEVISRFDREVHFYVAWTHYLEPLRKAGLPFAFPTVTASDKAEEASDIFDLALATRLVAADQPIVRNDFQLSGKERIFVVTGPNQGGKTTFARTFGQLHYLARLGVALPGRELRLLLCDEVLTHFERPENLSDIRGKLEDDLIRIHDILSRATGDSVVIMNEIFTSTTLEDALLLGAEVLARITELGSLAVCVTFVDELTTLNDATVSVVAGIGEAASSRTYRVERKVADGRAYASAIARGYQLTYRQIIERVSA